MENSRQVSSTCQQDSIEHQRGMREQEAAQYLGVSVKTLQSWRFYGRGPKYSRLGARAIIYTKQWCDEYREAGAVVPMGVQA